MHRARTKRAGSVAALLRLAGRQHGVFTSEQATQLGVTVDQCAGLVRRGTARRVRRGLYVATGSADDHPRRTMLAVVAGPVGTVASHESAAALLGIAPVPLQPHVTIGRRNSLRLDGVVAHRSVVPPHHRARVGAVPVTTLARTVVDLAATYDLEALGDLLDPLLVDKRLRPSQLLTTLDDIVERPGRHGTKMLRLCLAPWTDGIEPGSVAELRLVRRLLERGYGGFELQVPVETAGVRMRIDLGWPARRIGLEYIGRAFHGPRHTRRDLRRLEHLERAGWEIREVDATDLVPANLTLWAWLDARLRGPA